MQLQALIFRKFYGCPLDNLSAFCGRPKENLEHKEVAVTLEAVC